MNFIQLVSAASSAAAAGAIIGNLIATWLTIRRRTRFALPCGKYLSTNEPSIVRCTRRVHHPGACAATYGAFKRAGYAKAPF